MRPHLLALALLTAGCALPAPGGTAPAPYYAEVLSAAPFTSLVVEIDHAPGRAPSLAAQTHLIDTLRNVTAKHDITIKLDASLPDTPQTWTKDDLIALEQRTRNTPHQAPNALLHVLYPAGHYDRPGVAGVTISGPILSPITIFRDTLDDMDIGLPTGPLPFPTQARDEIERVTLLHETGHALGLVNNGLPMMRDHEDKAHPGHSTDHGSVMYWKFEQTTGLREALLHDGTLPDTYDADDRADMHAAGGR